MVTTAKPPEANPLDWLQTVPGLGKLRRRVLWYDRHDLARFPRGQACVSSGRVVTCAQEAAGTRSGPSGTKRGHAYRPWAFADAAVLVLRHPPAGHQSLVRFENTHGPGQALTVLAPQLARAVSHLLKRTTAVDLEPWRWSYGRGAGAPAASRGRDGLRLATVLCRAGRLVSANPAEPIGPGP
jgi:Transposase IS116/IS110/IS902 family